jgi:energy-converting hydrogenase A subunit M
MTIFEQHKSDAHEDENLLCQIGKVATQWAVFEALIVQLLAKMLNQDITKIQCMTAELSAYSRLTMLNCLAGEQCDQDVEFCKALSDILERAEYCRQWRNDLQHCIFKKTEDGVFNLLKLHKKGGELKLKKEDFDCAQATSWADELVTLSEDLSRLMEQI